jgi:hypothetical protein
MENKARKKRKNETTLTDINKKNRCITIYDEIYKKIGEIKYDIYQIKENINENIKTQISSILHSNKNSLNENSLNENSLNENSLNENSLNENSLNENSLNENSLNENSLNENSLNENSLNKNSHKKSKILYLERIIKENEIKRDKEMSEIKNEIQEIKEMILNIHFQKVNISEDKYNMSYIN